MGRLHVRYSRGATPTGRESPRYQVQCQYHYGMITEASVRYDSYCTSILVPMVRYVRNSYIVPYRYGISLVLSREAGQ